MTNEVYLTLAKNLQLIVKQIPAKWGNIQNNNWDSLLNLFCITDYETLQLKLAGFDLVIQNYFYRRWFIWKCAQCDEHIFCTNPNVLPNPNPKSQSYDIEFNHNPALRFDIKGTVIPQQFRNNIVETLQNPTPMLQFFYDKQSKGVRNFTQNRLFIIHHSYIKHEREIYLRCHWAYKTKVFAQYAQHINSQTKLIDCQNVKVDAIFIFENLDRTITHNFLSLA